MARLILVDVDMGRAHVLAGAGPPGQPTPASGNCCIMGAMGETGAHVERRITDALGAGNARAATEVALSGYGAELLGYFYSVLRDEDAAHEAFSTLAEDVCRGIGGFRGESSFRTWAYRVAWHVATR